MKLEDIVYMKTCILGLSEVEKNCNVPDKSALIRNEIEFRLSYASQILSDDEFKQFCNEVHENIKS